MPFPDPNRRLLQPSAGPEVQPLLGGGFTGATPPQAYGLGSTPSASPKSSKAGGINTGRFKVVVIGGAFDGYVPGFDIAHEYAKKFSQSLFLTHLDAQNERRTVQRIQRFSQGQPVIIIGHSVGSPVAYSLVKPLQRNGVSVPALFTMDPVGGTWSHRPGALWVNVSASPAKAQESDWVARAGRGLTLWPMPIKEADINAQLPVHHADLDLMMGTPLGNRPSAEEMIKQIVGPPE